MVQRVSTVAFEGIEVRPVDVQVQVAPGMPAFALAGCQCQNKSRRGCSRAGPRSASNALSADVTVAKTALEAAELIRSGLGLAALQKAAGEPLCPSAAALGRIEPLLHE
jgi:hypothetical protein